MALVESSIFISTDDGWVVFESALVESSIFISTDDGWVVFESALVTWH